MLRGCFLNAPQRRFGYMQQRLKKPFRFVSVTNLANKPELSFFKPKPRYCLQPLLWCVLFPICCSEQISLLFNAIFIFSSKFPKNCSIQFVSIWIFIFRLSALEASLFGQVHLKFNLLFIFLFDSAQHFSFSSSFQLFSRNLKLNKIFD